MTFFSRPHRRRGASLVAALALPWSSLALAAPAVIKQRTEARSAPFAVAPLVEDVFAGTKVDADETTTDGWRRVRLPSGRFAFVVDVNVDLSHVTPAAPTPDTAVPVVVQPLAAPGAGARAPLYVGDFSHLAELVASDPKAYDLATTFATEQSVSSAAIWGGVFGGLALWVLSNTAFKKTTCAGGLCADSTNSTMHDVGTTILILGPLVGWAVRPTKDDQTKVIDAWNERHPDRPFVDHAGVEAPQ